MKYKYSNQEQIIRIYKFWPNKLQHILLNVWYSDIYLYPIFFMLMVSPFQEQGLGDKDQSEVIKKGYFFCFLLAFWTSIPEIFKLDMECDTILSQLCTCIMVKKNSSFHMDRNHCLYIELVYLLPVSCKHENPPLKLLKMKCYVWKSFPFIIGLCLPRRLFSENMFLSS
jgi:hypothetical protein